MPDAPFMEHPTGEFSTAVDAMENAIARLRALPEWNRWITFCAQGEGSSPDTTRCAEVRLLSDVLELSRQLNVARIASLAQVPSATLTEAGENRYSLATASARSCSDPRRNFPPRARNQAV